MTAVWRRRHHQRQYPCAEGYRRGQQHVKVYDGSTLIGTTKANSTGSWEYITAVLTDAKHVLTATATSSSGQISARQLR